MDHYKILSEKIEGTYIADLGPGSSGEEIKSNYRKLAQYYHPDKHVNNPLQKLAEEKLKDINIAYQVLGDPVKRQGYDATYPGGGAAGTPKPETKKAPTGPEPAGGSAKPGKGKGIGKGMIALIACLGTILIGLIILIVILADMPGPDQFVPVKSLSAGKETDPAETLPAKSPAKKSPAPTTAQPSPTPSVPASPAITFTDANLESAIRKQMNKPQGDILESDAEKIASLNLHAAKIADISALKYFKNLTELELGDNQITDISALSSLTKLTALSLSKNPLGDITALSGLQSLTTLRLQNTGIQDIGALFTLTNLKQLELDGNQIKDIAVLSALSNLETLALQQNQIQDVSPLSGLTKLQTLYLAGNPITDFSPLQGLNLTAKDF